MDLKKLNAAVDKKLTKMAETYKGRKIESKQDPNGVLYPYVDGKKIDHGCDTITECYQVAKQYIDSKKV